MKQLRQKVHSERRGVVLLLVLVALIAVSTALVSIARESYRVGQEAVRAREDLQMKWGEESLRRSVLPAAPAIYEEAEKAFRKSRREGRMPTEYSGVFSLGDAQFQFVLADEDARAN
ncbi:MAG: hypothetical protein AB8G99_23335, partial [Planctomycetaceae bacterium]